MKKPHLHDKTKTGLCIEKFVITVKLSRCWRYGPNTLAMSNYIVATPAQAFRYDQDLPLFLQQVDLAMRQPYSTVPPYITKDGSEIRELMHPRVHGNRAQSLAEATVPAGARTLLHRHEVTEELYHITAGAGVMTLGEKQFPVLAGDTVLIAPGTPHCIEAVGDTALVLLCCCSPAYEHADTLLIDD